MIQQHNHRHDSRSVHFLLVVCVTATITEGYGSYRHGGIVGHTGLYKNHLTSYKDLLTGYGNDHAAGHFHKIVVGRLYRRFHQFGIDLIGNGLRYKNYYFARKCEPLKLYNAFSSCFNEYGRIEDCFPGLIKDGLIGHQHHYQRYGRSYGLGVKFVRRGIIYHKTGYNVDSDYAHGDIDYLGYYNSHHGFPLVHGGFTYKDVAYKLSCKTDRFYRSWHDCYDSYHSVDVCFGRLYKSHLFVSLAYTLKCSESRFYKVWDDCYGHYHKGSVCFDRLFKQGLFGYNVDSDYAHGDIDYLGYYNSHHGFHLVDGGFTYKDVAYKLSCKTDRFYRSWHDCYDSYHSVDVCFGRLYKSHLFVSLGYYHGASSIVNGGNYVDDFGYYKAHHGFSIVNGGFSYNGAAYKLSCSRTRFYKAWRSCYGTYHSVDVCYGRLLNDHLFVALDHGDNYSVHTNYHGYKYLGFKLHHRRFSYHGKGYYHGSSSIVHGGDYIDDLGYYKAHHGFSIVNGGFSYNGAGGGHGYTNYHGYKYLGFRIRHRRFSYLGKAYRLKFGTRRFYKLWDDCYNTYHDRSVCFNNLYKRHIFGYYHGSSSVVHGSDYINDFGYYKAHHGFSIVNGGFSYNGAGGHHGYHNYHGYKYLGFRIRHRRFSYLGKDYYGEYAHAHIGASYRGDYGYYTTHHGFSIVGGNFLYKGAGPDYDYSFLRKNLYLHRKIAAHHVNRINAVANSHVGRINLVAHTHTRNINHVAKTHVNRISSEANSHIKRFLKIANSHLYRLQKHSKIHLHSLEEQHKRHLLERENQHKTHVVNKEILNHKHEHAIAAAHHYAKGGVYAPAGTVIKTVSHGSYGDYK
ncbi:unnamed protein product [Mytilus edulis]|uniref:Uncharacterized protein n=1 Tax=Mytilus edulis TaxID=6550 RepID=A0A8S3SZZ5_MYTED|nr:unnamed protein product [Mytilus edulis]